jgi:signal transduction histidine kinase/DNA-binding response OmpR family regulator
MTDLERIFPGETEMARRMRAFDWTRTPLGPPDRWPNSLRTSTRIILTSRHPMFVWWGEQLINLYNDGYAQFLHCLHPWALGRPAAEVWPEIWPQVGPRAEFARRQEVGTYDEALPFVMHRKGYPEETYVTFSYSPIPDDTGRFGGILCPVTEETQRVMAERQVALLKELAARTGEARSPREACELAASSLATNPDDLPFALIYLREADSRVLNLAGCFGVTPGGDAGPQRLDPDVPSYWEVSDALDAPHSRVIVDVSHIAATLPRARGRFQLEHAAFLPLLTGPKKSQAGGLLIVGLNPLRLYDDNYEQFLQLASGAVSTAITNAQAYEFERKRSESLAELDRAKTEFFSNVSHEFRTPLTLLLGFLEEELQQPGSSERLHIAHRNGLRLLKLVNGLLDFSRIEAGHMTGAYAPTDLATLTAELGSVFHSAIEKAGIRFHLECPPLRRPVYVDPAMWEQIVLNLLSNAFKFTFAGEIAMSLGAAASFVRLTVSDTGCGIAQTHLPHIFERFYRIQHNRSRTHEGSGIGLALVEKLVHLHGGRVSVKSTVDRGTTFTVEIPFGTDHLPADKIVAAHAADENNPLRRAALVDEAQLWLATDDVRLHPERLPEAAPALPAVPRARILVADDNADLRLYLSSLIEREHDAIVVTDGEAALAAVSEHHPDLIVADVTMPRLDGYGLVARLRADPASARLPIILLSARAEEDARIEGLEHGADDYLIKPFSARELRARINTHLGLAKARQAVERTLQESNQELERKVEARTAALRESEERKASSDARFREHQAMLLAELQHRVRNIIALIRSVTTRTSHGAHSVAEYADLLSGRLLTLARVQALLTRAGHVGVNIRDIIQDEVSAQAGHDSKYGLTGPDVTLSPKATEVITMALHELATNAAKYGALSVPRGQVQVNWSTFDRSGTRWLGLQWIELGGPSPAQMDSQHRGFGSELIEELIPYELGGEGSLTLTPEGARCSLEFPLKDGASILETDAPQRSAVLGSAIDMRDAACLAGRSILVVEDDYYLAGDVAHTIRCAGGEALGPCATESAAGALLETSSPSAVVLDINLGNGPSYHLARLLKERGVPYVFITGYEATAIPTEFNNVVRLAKPVELRRVVNTLADVINAAGSRHRRSTAGYR